MWIATSSYLLVTLTYIKPIWIVCGTYGKSLSVSFVDVDIEEDPYCIYDYVDVIEVNATETIIKDYILYIILTVHCYQCI